jgi:PAS domain-containing protein
MTEYLVFTASIVLGAAAGIAAYLCAQKWRAGAQVTTGGDGAMLRTLIDNLPDLIYVKDVDGRFLLANVAVARVMGASSPSELLGKNDFDFHAQELATLYHEDE